jgi:hypothetical protein
MFPLFATCVIDTGGKFATGFVDNGGNLPLATLTPVTNLPPVSTKPAELVAKDAAGVVDTGHKFTVGVLDTNGATCEYLREFLKKFKMTLVLFSGAWGQSCESRRQMISSISRPTFREI